MHKQISEKLTACESWQIAGTPPCLTADLDRTVWTSCHRAAFLTKLKRKIVPAVQLFYY